MQQEPASITREWLNGDEIVVYRLNSASLPAITSWSDLALNTIREWPKDKPYKAIHDLSKPGVGLLYMAAVQYDVFQLGITPGGSALAVEMLKQCPDWRLSVAVVVSHSLTGRMTKLRVFRSAHENLNLESEVFFNQSSALGWINRMSAR